VVTHFDRDVFFCANLQGEMYHGTMVSHDVATQDRYRVYRLSLCLPYNIFLSKPFLSLTSISAHRNTDAMAEACCTCATLLTSVPPTYDVKTEKPSQYERRLECCSRAICARCITDNPRFAIYCPFCQVSIVPSPLPQGLRDPPAYSPPAGEQTGDEPPPYSAHNPLQPPTEKSKSKEAAPDVLHFVDANNDSIGSLSIRYGVPAEALRRTNGLYADHLLAARRTILIPGEYYKGGVSLSPRPLEGEEEEIRKGKVRKFMVGCKLAE
jgi:LysM repeat protein